MPYTETRAEQDIHNTAAEAILTNIRLKEVDRVAGHIKHINDHKEKG